MVVLYRNQAECQGVGTNKDPVSVGQWVADVWREFLSVYYYALGAAQVIHVVLIALAFEHGVVARGGLVTVEQDIA